MLRGFLERRRLRRLFGDGIDKIDPEVPLPQSSYRELDFLIVHLREEPAGTLPVRVAAAAEIASAHDAYVESICSSILVLSYGWFPDQTPPDARSTLVGALLARLPHDASVVHGQRECLVGSFGSSGRLVFGSQIPGFGELVKLAVDLDFGRSLEV